eukprot:502075-Pleurochrysis_carterae.AAC.1
MWRAQAPTRPRASGDREHLRHRGIRACARGAVRRRTQRDAAARSGVQSRAARRHLVADDDAEACACHVGDQQLLRGAPTAFNGSSATAFYERAERWASDKAIGQRVASRRRTHTWLLGALSKRFAVPSANTD